MCRGFDPGCYLRVDGELPSAIAQLMSKCM